MDNKFDTNLKLFKTLEKMFDLPPRCISLNISMSIEHEPMITCKYYPNLEKEDAVTETFKIVK